MHGSNRVKLEDHYYYCAWFKQSQVRKALLLLCMVQKSQVRKALLLLCMVQTESSQEIITIIVHGSNRVKSEDHYYYCAWFKQSLFRRSLLLLCMVQTESSQKIITIIVHGSNRVKSGDHYYYCTWFKQSQVLHICFSVVVFPSGVKDKHHDREIVLRRSSGFSHIPCTLTCNNIMFNVSCACVPTAILFFQHGDLFTHAIFVRGYYRSCLVVFLFVQPRLVHGVELLHSKL